MRAFPRLILIIICCSLSVINYGQRNYVTPQGEVIDAYGKPLTTTLASTVEGSPFLFDTYVPGRLVVNGILYSKLTLKLNLEDNIVFFEKDGVEMVPSLPVSVAELFDAGSNSFYKFRNGFPDINKNTAYTFYQVLDSGKVVLLKHLGRVLHESRQYGNAAKVQRYEQIKSYYLFTNNEIIPIKKIESITDVLQENKSTLDKFISTNKIKVTRESDLKSLIEFYNKS